MPGLILELATAVRIVPRHSSGLHCMYNSRIDPKISNSGQDSPKTFKVGYIVYTMPGLIPNSGYFLEQSIHSSFVKVDVDTSLIQGIS